MKNIKFIVKGAMELFLVLSIAGFTYVQIAESEHVRTESNMHLPAVLKPAAHQSIEQPSGQEQLSVSVNSE